MTDYALITQLIEDAEHKAELAKVNSNRQRNEAIVERLYGDHAKGDHLLRLSAQSLNDYFYWIGHVNAYKGVLKMEETVNG